MAFVFKLVERFVNFSPDLPIGQVRDAILRALHLWSDSSTLTFHEVQTGRADIDFLFAKNNHDDGYSFDGPGQ
jgi:matrix metalloproteinase-17 (membrane-inserted)